MGIGFFNLHLLHLTMRAVSRGIVYSLMAVVLILLVGIAALISVANHRHQQLEDTTIDLQRNLSQQERKIRDLQQRLENCDTIQAHHPCRFGLEYVVNNRINERCKESRSPSVTSSIMRWSTYLGFSLNLV